LEQQQKRIKQKPASESHSKPRKSGAVGAQSSRMAEPYTQNIHVGDNLAELERVQEFLSELWGSRGLPEDIEGSVSLALEEVLSNVLRHSRLDGRSCQIKVVFAIYPDGFEFEVSDSAPPYNPLLQPDPDVNAPLDQRERGGLGVFLVKRLADEVSYDRRDERNCLRFRKSFPLSCGD
jgi:serine/threonine-protein kinase RsbW